jgi:transposase
MRVTSKHYLVRHPEHAVKMVLDHLGEYRSVYATYQAIGPKSDVGAESLRRWVLQAQMDACAAGCHDCRGAADQRA